MNKSLKKWFHAAALAALAGCVDGDSPSGVGIPRSVSIGALPSFAITPTQEELAVLDSSRVILRDLDNGSIVADTAFAIDPSVEEWVFDLKVELAAGQVLSLSLTVELFDIHVDPQSVEWSGRTEEPFDVQASFEPRTIGAHCKRFCSPTCRWSDNGLLAAAAR